MNGDLWDIISKLDSIINKMEGDTEELEEIGNDLERLYIRLEKWKKLVEELSGEME